jgi:DNA-binding HxlR family transcriptional regulator
MDRKSFAGMDCSVAQCLEVVGEWWSMLIVRDAFLGVTRFDDFQRRLGISRNILHDRLNTLVDADVLTRMTSGRSSPQCVNGATATSLRAGLRWWSPIRHAAR